MISARKINLLFRGRFLFAKALSDDSTLKQVAILSVFGLLAAVILSFRENDNFTLIGSSDPSELVSIGSGFYTREGEALDILDGNKRGPTKKRSPYLEPGITLWTPLDDVKIPEGLRVSASTLSPITEHSKKVVAALDENLKVDGEVVATRGSRLLGSVSVESSERYILSFHTLKTDAGELKISALAIDDDELAGLLPNTFKKRALSVAKTLTLTFLGGMAEGLQDRAGRAGQRSPRIKDAALEGVKDVAHTEAGNSINDARNENSLTSIGTGRKFIIEFMTGETYEK